MNSKRASMVIVSETAPKQLDLISTEAQPAFALMATARSPVAIAQRRRSRGASACAACAPRVLLGASLLLYLLTFKKPAFFSIPIVIYHYSSRVNL